MYQTLGVFLGRAGYILPGGTHHSAPRMVGSGPEVIVISSAVSLTVEAVPQLPTTAPPAAADTQKPPPLAHHAHHDGYSTVPPGQRSATVPAPAKAGIVPAGRVSTAASSRVPAIRSVKWAP